MKCSRGWKRSPTRPAARRPPLRHLSEVIPSLGNAIAGVGYSLEAWRNRHGTKLAVTEDIYFSVDLPPQHWEPFRVRGFSRKRKADGPVDLVTGGADARRPVAPRWPAAEEGSHSCLRASRSREEAGIGGMWCLESALIRLWLRPQVTSSLCFLPGSP